MLTRFLRHIPIKRKLTIITMLTSGVALLVACVAVVVYEQLAFRRTMEMDLSILTDLFDDNVASGLAFNDAKSVTQTLSSLSAHPRLMAAVVYDKAGQVVARYVRPNEEAVFRAPEARETGTRFQKDRLEAFRRVVLDGEMIGTIYIVSDLRELATRFWRFGLIVTAVLGVSALVALALSARLQQVISGPLTHLAEVAGRVATGRDYSVRAVKHGEDELGKLIDAFNEMLSQIQSQDNALQEAREKLEERVQERTQALVDEVRERRRTEDERDRIFTLSLDMLCIAHVDGSFHRVNPAFGKTLGWSPEELLARPLFELVSPEDQPAVAEQVQGLAAGRPMLAFEIRCRCQDGSYRWIAWSASPSDPAGLFCACGRDVTERKRADAELEETHKKLLTASRQAGMAEVATGVLHNVGNVLNSVNVSANLVADSLRRSKVSSLPRIAALLDAHASDLGHFFTADSRGQQLPGYIRQLAEHLTKEQAGLLKETELLRDHLEHIKEIVAMQQSYAKVSGIIESIKVTELVEDALRLNAGALERHRVAILRQYDAAPVIGVDKHKVLQILINLIRNAKYACEETDRTDKELTVRVTQGDDRVSIAVSDNGVGIPAENLTRIFAHGFTTRKDGHGFGLHSGALAAKEMGGALNVCSEGPDKGATFTLELPFRKVAA